MKKARIGMAMGGGMVVSRITLWCCGQQTASFIHAEKSGKNLT